MNTENPWKSLKILVFLKESLIYLDVMRKYEAKIIIDLDFGLGRLGIEFFSGFTFYASQ